MGSGGSGGGQGMSGRLEGESRRTNQSLLPLLWVDRYVKDGGLVVILERKEKK